MQAILGKKIGMTQVLNSSGHFVAATVLEAGPCVVTALKDAKNHGYKSAQIGYAEGNVKRIGNALKTFFEKGKIPVKRWLREVRLTEQENFEVGQEIKVDIFKPGDLLDIQGTTMGRGFAGGMKRWDWRGGAGSHGSMHHRRIGSAGSNTYPGRTWPGQKMAGHMGNATCTVQNLEVLKVDASKNMIVVRGAVPGKGESLLYIRRSLKQPAGVKPKVAQAVKKEKNPLKASKQAAAGGGKKK